MRAIIQRASHAHVKVNDEIIGEISHGLVVLIGIVDNDEPGDIDWLVRKITAMRIFADDEGKMNRNIIDVNGELLIVSQFTLHASTKKGNRPSFTKAAKPEVAIPLYEQFTKAANSIMNKSCQTGQFGADMKVSLTNDGPVTIMIDSKQRE